MDIEISPLWLPMSILQSYIEIFINVNSTGWGGILLSGVGTNLILVFDYQYLFCQSSINSVFYKESLYTSTRNKGYT